MSSDVQDYTKLKRNTRKEISNPIYSMKGITGY